MDRKRKLIEDEMSRFEAEIAKPSSNLFVPSQVRTIIGSNTFNQMQQKLHQHHHHQSPIPSMAQTTHSFVSSFAAASMILSQDMPEKSYSTEPTPIVLSSAPKLYTNRPTVSSKLEIQSVPQAPPIDIATIQFDVSSKIKKLKTDKPGPNPIAEAAIQAARASSALQSFGQEERRRTKNKKTVRVAGGQVWEDSSLADWPDDDFRIFCGDLGNDVNDELLTRTFNKYSSFRRAKVIRDKRTGKSKGYGFISFKEPQDFIRAMKEMDGRYVGSRPIKLRKSTWKARSLDTVKKKEKEKQALLQLFNKN